MSSRSTQVRQHTASGSGSGTAARRTSGLMSPPPPPLPTSAPSHTGGSSFAIPTAVNERRPSSAASQTSSRRGTGTSAQSSLATNNVVRRRRIEDLVLATVPAARSRRSETDQRKVEERRAFRTELADLADDILHAGAGSSSSMDQSQIVTQLKRKLSRHDPDGAHGSAVRLETIISKLKRQPDVSRNLNGLLHLFDGLAFTSKTSGLQMTADAGITRSRSSMLNVPDAPGLRKKERGELHRDGQSMSGLSSPNLLGAESSRESLPLAPVSPRVENRAQSLKNDNEDAKIHMSQAQNELSSEDLKLPKAKLLEQWRERKGVHLLPETDILKDVIYLLQGINGKYVGFEEIVIPASNDIGETREAEKAIIVKFYGEAQKRITEPMKQLIHQVIEPGRLYKRIYEFQRERMSKQGEGLVMQSFCHFLSSELTDYYRLIAILESQMKQQQSIVRDGRTSEQADSRKGLTLRRVRVWTQDVLLRLRLISTIVEGCKDAHGGAMVSLIHNYTFHGDPLIRKLTAEILDHVAKPFFKMLSSWIFEGELYDPFEEFFVQANANVKATTAPAIGIGEDAMSGLYLSSSLENPARPSSLWQNQFRFRPEMLPSFLDETFGRKIFSAGKSLNFIRFSCGDADWVAANVASRHDKNALLRYANLPALERTIDEAYASASTRLLDIFLGKFKLLEHLRALKDYLMLTKGDYSDTLMESLGPSLDRPAAELLRHDLTACLETAIRSSNSQYDDADIVGRLDVRILDFKEGDLGWDSFTLEYRVDEPVSTVLDNDAMTGYQVIFTHLCTRKRVEVTLSRCWERLLLATNMLRRAQPRDLTKRSTLPGRRARQASVRDVDPVSSTADTKPIKGDAELLSFAHEALGHLGEQIHFIKQLQGFTSLEVIEYSWNDLTQLFASHTTKRRLIDLDELIASHRAYLNALLAKVQLRSAGGRKDQPTKDSKETLDPQDSLSAKDRDTLNPQAKDSSESKAKDERNTNGKDTSELKVKDTLELKVKDTLDLMMTFAMAIDDLARYIADEMARRDLDASRGAGARARQTTTSSSLGSSSTVVPSSHANTVGGSPEQQQQLLINIQTRVTSHHVKFQTSTQSIIARLEKHSNLVVRDLATRLNFNSYYTHLSQEPGNATASAGNPANSSNASGMHRAGRSARTRDDGSTESEVV